MMRKTLVIALITLFSSGITLAQVALKDTSLAAVPGNYIPFYTQNLQVKSRLDSIQKTVPLTYNEYVQKFIDLYSSRKEQISKVIGLSAYYFPIFEKSLKEYQIPDEIKFLSVVESSLDPHAVSRTGATGPWQFMPATARGYGMTMNKTIDERKDPATSSHAAAAYFRNAYDELGDWLLAIAAYNCGTGAVTRAIKRSGGKTDFWEIRPFLPLETRNYVPAFIATTYIMNCYSKHDIMPVKSTFPTLTDVIEVSTKVSLDLIAKAANFDLNQLLSLNPSFKKHIVDGSPALPKHIVVPGTNGGDTYVAIYQVLNEDQPMVAAARIKGPKPVAEIGSLPKYISYKVRSGDTLSSIADKFNGTIAGIRSRNKLRSTVLQPGMILKISKG